jgi:hypothetical protein
MASCRFDLIKARNDMTKHIPPKITTGIKNVQIHFVHHHLEAGCVAPVRCELQAFIYFWGVEARNVGR